MNTDSLINLVRSKTRAQFVAALPNYFLVMSNDAGDSKTISFRTVAVSPGTQPDASATLAPGVEIIEVMKAAGNPYPERIAIGRARNCDVVIRDQSVSKLHAHFRVGERGKLDLVDAGSQNGTRVNGRQLAPNAPTPVQCGDKLTIGRVQSTLMDPASLYDMLRLLTQVGGAFEAGQQ